MQTPTSQYIDIPFSYYCLARMETCVYINLIMSSKLNYATLGDLILEGRCSPEILNYENLRWADARGNTIAHLLAKSVPLDRVPRKLITTELLCLANKEGWTVSHEVAACGHLNRIPKNLITLELLSMFDGEGHPVAHVAIEMGHESQIPSELITPELLRLRERNVSGHTIKETLELRQGIASLLGRLLIERAPKLAPLVDELLASKYPRAGHQIVG